MLERIQRNLAYVMAHLLQMSPNQQLGWMIAVLVFLLVVNMASNALLDVLKLSPLFTLLLLPLLLAILLAWNGWRSLRTPDVPEPSTGDRPAPHPGLILMLGLFNSAGNKQRPGLAGADWRRKQLAEAVNAPAPDWPLIIERFEHSNMQPALEAIRHHSTDGILQHIWLIATDDLKTREGQVVQEGSKHLAPLFEKVIKEGFGFEAQIHYQDPQLTVSPYDVTATYRAVEHIYAVAAQQVGLLPSQVIADLTGGRVPMTGGMILACAPRGWRMQYTTTDRDPVKQGPGDQPAPLEIKVDVRSIQRCSLEALYGELSLADGGQGVSGGRGA